jgi:hypothetical protein
MRPCPRWGSPAAARAPSTRVHGGAGRGSRGGSCAVLRRGKREAVHGSMGGWYEIRLTDPGREQFRLFCLLENGTGKELARRGLPGPGHRRDHGDAQALADRVRRARLPACTGTRHRAPGELPAPHCDLTSPSACAGVPGTYRPYSGRPAAAPAGAWGLAQHGNSGDTTRYPIAVKRYEHSIVSVANQNPGSLTGSQRPQSQGRVGPYPAITVAAEQHVRRHPASPRHTLKVPPKQ